MHQFTHDEILDEIHKLFDWNPPLLSLDPSTRPKLIPPSSFYYDHLDQKLSLREITLMPDLIPNLSKTVDRVLQDIKEQEITLPPVVVGDMFPSVKFREAQIYDDPITDAHSVGQAYQRTTGHHCKLVSSMLFLSPRSPSWRGFYTWGSVEPGSKTNPGLDQTRALHLKNRVNSDGVVTIDDVWKSIHGETRATLQHIIQQSPVLALWEIFASTPSNANLLKILGEPRVIVRQESATITKQILPELRLPDKPDAVKFPWGTPMSALSGKTPASVSSDTLDEERLKIPHKRSFRPQKGAIIKNLDIQSEEHTGAITLPKKTEPTRETLSE
ncbi:hypothetical protein BDZ94DRAFT_1316118, partial [Collybia nuda]